MGVDQVHTLAKVNGPLYQGVLWVSIGISMVFVGFRLWVRRQTLKKFFADDYLVCLALLCFIISAALQQTHLKYIYELYALQEGKILPDLAWMRGQSALLHNLAGWNILFYTGLWTVKISFLVFFRHLNAGVKKHRYWWWIVFSITVASWAVCIGDIQWDCMMVKVENDFAGYIQCGMPDKVRFQRLTFYLNCALDVITDFLIISVPVALLWNRRIALKMKLILIGLFSMTVLVMCIAVVRVAVVSIEDRPADVSWLYFWSDIELAMALLVSSLASFRQLYTSNKPERTNPRPSGYPSGICSSCAKNSIIKEQSIVIQKSEGSLTDEESLKSINYRPVA